MPDCADKTEEQKKNSRERSRRYYEKNKERACALSRLWYDGNKERSREIKRKYSNSARGRAIELMIRIKRQAKGRRFGKPGFDFDLTVEWIEARINAGFCEKTGIQFDLRDRDGGWVPFSPSVDRIDSKKGYTMDNCRVVCKIYNMAKNQFSDEDVLTMSRALVSIDEK